METSSKKGSPKWPRHYEVLFPAESMSFAIVDDKTGRFLPFLHGRPVPANNIYVHLWYQGANKAKTTCLYKVNPDFPTVNPNVHLTTYGHVVAVDTSYATDRTVSVSAAVHCTAEAGEQDIAFNMLEATAIELHNVAQDQEPEWVGWRMCLDRLKRMIAEPRPRSVMIVDSSLGDLERINRRHTRIIDILLPLDMDIMYAADRASDNIAANDCIRQCDSLAKHILSIASQAPSDSLFPVDGAGFTAYRNWKIFPRTPDGRPRVEPIQCAVDA